MGVTAAVGVLAVTAASTAYSANQAHEARNTQERAQNQAKREAQRIQDETPKAIDPAAAARRRAIVGANQVGRGDTILAGGTGQRSTILGG